MQIYFIDVARCRIRFGFQLPRVILFDLYTPLRDLELPPEESREFLRLYYGNFPECAFTLPDLENALLHYRRHHHRYNVLDGRPNS